MSVPEYELGELSRAVDRKVYRGRTPEECSDTAQSALHTYIFSEEEWEDAPRGETFRYELTIPRLNKTESHKDKEKILFNNKRRNSNNNDRILFNIKRQNNMSDNNEKILFNRKKRYNNNNSEKLFLLDTLDYGDDPRLEPGAALRQIEVTHTLEVRLNTSHGSSAPVWSVPIRIQPATPSSEILVTSSSSHQQQELEQFLKVIPPKSASDVTFDNDTVVRVNMEAGVVFPEPVWIPERSVIGH